MVKSIYTYPKDKEILTQKSQEVTEFTQEIKTIIQDLKDTVVANHGVGISAVQIGIPLQICVINWGGLHVLVNPKVTRSRGVHTLKEGCLSVPGLFVKTTRPQKVWITALDENGKEYEYAEGGNGSFIALHEIDHFEGKCPLFTTYDEMLNKYIEQMKEQEALNETKEEQKTEENQE